MKWKYLPGIVISALFLYLAFRRVNVGDLKRSFEHADYVYVIPAFLLNLASLWIRAFRWRFLLRPMKTIGMASLFNATAIGFMGNNLLPARLGEIMRAHVLGGKEKISRSAALATIVVERVFDGFTLLFFLALVFVAASPSFPGWLKKASAVAIAFYICALVFLILFVVKRGAVMRASETISRPLPEYARRLVFRALNSFANGLGVLRSRRDIVVTALLSPLVWLPNAAIIYLILLSFGIHLSAAISFLLLVAVCIGIMIPSAPGYIGTIQFVSVGVLTLFGVSRGDALSFSIVYHGCIFIPITAAGLVCLFTGKVSFDEMRIVIRQKE